jgi:hypothetical protein
LRDRKREPLGDIRAEVHERRREIVGDLIGVMLAYQRAKCPNVGVSPFGSYEAWSRMVRQALVWAGEADPCLSLERTRGADPERLSRGVVLGAWYRVFKEVATTVAEAVKQAENDAALREALAIVCEKRGKLDNHTLGIWLRDAKDKRSGDLVLRDGLPDGHTGMMRWAVLRGIAGNGRECSTSPRAKRDRENYRYGSNILRNTPHPPQMDPDTETATSEASTVSDGFVRDNHESATCATSATSDIGVREGMEEGGV